MYSSALLRKVPSICWQDTMNMKFLIDCNEVLPPYSNFVYSGDLLLVQWGVHMCLYEGPKFKLTGFLCYWSSVWSGWCSVTINFHPSFELFFGAHCVVKPIKYKSIGRASAANKYFELLKILQFQPSISFKYLGGRERCEVPNIATSITSTAHEIYVWSSDWPKHQDKW